MSDQVPPIQRRAHAFVRALLKRIEQEPDVHQALTAGTWLSRYLWVNCCGIYRCDELEQILLAKLPPLPAFRPVHQGPELHVASMVLRKGGHTQVMKSLMRQASVPPRALITWPIDIGEAAAILEVDPSRVQLIAPQADKLADLAQIVECMLAYDHVVLHIHPDDVLCALAVRLAKIIRPDLVVAFLNHADHVYSAGIGAVDKVFEISGYGWRLRPQRQIEDRATFVGIPIQAPAEKPPSQATQHYALTGGTAYKYRPFAGRSLPPVLRQLLKQDRSLSIRILGTRSKDYWWWPLRIAGRKRVHMMKSLPRAAYLDLLHNCAYYIDSYPWTGGTAFPEALMRGVPVVGLNGGGSGYSCADSLRVNSTAEFLRTCDLIGQRDPQMLGKQAAARAQCIAFHAPAATRARMERGLSPGFIEVPPPAVLPPHEMPTVAQDWLQSARSVTPPMKGLHLNQALRRLIWNTHRRHFGLFDAGTLKLGFDFFVKRKK